MADVVGTVEPGIFSTNFLVLISPTTLALFVAFLYHHKYAPSTVTTYVSAIFSYSRQPVLSNFHTHM